jgi:hypothetical protein
MNYGSDDLDDEDNDKPTIRYHSERESEYYSVRDSLATSQAYDIFKADLLDFLHQPYERCILSAISENLTGSPGDHMEQHTRRHIAREISWVPTHLLTFSYDASISYCDRFKALVESHIGETWNWWPLAAQVHRLSSGYCRLGWISVSVLGLTAHNSTAMLTIPFKPCRTFRHVGLLTVCATAVKQAMKLAPAFINIDIPTDTCSRSPCGDNKTGSRPSHNNLPPSQCGSSGMTSAPVPLNRSSRTQLINMLIPVAMQSTSTATPNTPCQRVNQYLSMCVTRGSNQFVNIDCNNLSTDVALYEKMKDEYNRIRGRLRLWFSIWRYSHCEFVLFKKYGYHLGAPLEINIFPKHDDSDYLFEPRWPSPAPPHGPISVEEFRDHYYLNDCPSLYTWARYQRRYHGHFNKVVREALESFPKKKNTQINMEDGVSERFYGLHAKEQRSAFRVTVYACLCNLPGVIFLFLWLFQWGHDYDLQNASQLLTLSLSFTLGFAAIVFGTRDST